MEAGTTFAAILEIVLVSKSSPIPQLDEVGSHHLRGSEWIMHIPVEGYLEELTEKASSLQLLIILSLSGVEPSGHAYS